MPRAFIIRGFGKKKDRDGHEFDFDRVEAELIRPAMARCGLAGGTTATEEDSGNIREDMFALILEADVVICDITVHNANVFYELGIRHALRKKHTVLLRGNQSTDVTPFDLSTDRYLAYDLANPAAALDALANTLEASLRTTRETDSPIFLLLPTLTEANPQEVTVVPLDLVDEVERASAARDKAWLRIIAEDLQDQRYERDGLRVVARAQWSLKDLDGAQASWERVLGGREGDVESHLALANLYERQYRASRRATLLTASNQAIRKVLEAERVSTQDRAEALALQGRNAKTVWRERFEKAEVAASDEARKLALDTKAREAWDAYRAAFDCDLNKYYAGIAALQMGRILRELAALPGWPNLFKGNQRDADRAREDLDAELPALTHVVQAAVRRALELERGDDKMYAEITAADLLFLNQPDAQWQADPSTVVEAYRNAIPADKAWAFDATAGQLRLFQKLGFRAPLVDAVLAALPAEAPAKKARHLVVFTGHGIDRPGTPTEQRRFPPEAEARARQLIQERLAALQAAAGANETITLLASGAPGADILAHDAAKALGITRRLCLPMPAVDVSRIAFAGLDDWRARFLTLAEEMQGDQTLQLADSDKLPRWLQGRGIDPWSRGNRWVLKLAQTSGAPRVTVLALWNGVDDGRDGGTAQMVRLARSEGSLRFVHIGTDLLLG
ncbi:MAG: hypothetical protein JNL30_08570 [Rubrivivax sp.]|nr:hypothetical protein [Rubrivivax sp.]